MKRYLILLVLAALYTSVLAQKQIITKEQAIEFAKKLTAKNDVNVYISKQTITGNQEIITMYESMFAPDYENYLIFIDEYPFESWWHDCKYIFIDIISGDFKTMNMKYPPDLATMDVIKEKVVTKKGELFQVKKNTKNFISSDNEWAVIISGGYDMSSNHERYWNDCAAIYSSLINVYGYHEDHIFVIMSDGTNPANDRHLISGGYDSSPLDLDEDGDNDIQFAATRANITNVFNTLSALLNTDDNLFIYTTDHGGQEGGQNAFIYLWSQQLRDDELAQEVNKINAQRINIVMEQCYSGGFIDDLQSINRVIATACRYDESSHATSNLTYDEFVFYWTAAIASEMPNGIIVDADENNDEFVSMFEAFNYAKNQDTKIEHPQYSSIPTTIGHYLSLSGTIPYITGSTVVCASNSTYTIQNRPIGTTIVWTLSSNLLYVSGQGTDNYTLKANSSSNNGIAWVHATINGVIFEKVIWIGKPSFSLSGDKELETGLMGISEINYNYSTNQGITSSNWAKSGAIASITGGPVLAKYTAGYAPGSGTVDLTMSNQCGSTFKYFIVLVTGDDLIVYPNPVNNELTVEINFDDSSQFILAEDAVIYLYDKMMELKKTKHFFGTSTTINVSDLKTDYYILKVIIGDKTFEDKVIISRE